MKLEEIRQQIDVVDDNICKLLVERFDLSKAVAEAKKSLGFAIENKDREREVIESVRAKMPDAFKDYAEKVFLLLIEESKDYQKKL